LSATDDFLRKIDGRSPADRSVALRYRSLVRFSSDRAEDERVRAELSATSLREGARIFPLLEYREVAIDVLDLSSRMESRTLKSVDGCVTTAHCRAAGLRRVAFESGGNTGTALTRYARHAGLETFCFVPAANLPLLDASTFGDADAHLIAVDDPARLKDVLERFTERTGVARVPRTGWRLQASTLVGCFVLEALLGGATYDWLAQSISAAFGPIGVYRTLLEHRAALPRLPRFLGIQQAANCPMVRAWRSSAAPPDAEPLLIEVMYDRESQRYGTFEALRHLLVESDGDLAPIARSQYESRLREQGDDIVERFARAGAALGVRGGEIIEKAGVLSLVGVLEAIDDGRIAPGSRVLTCLTGGTGSPDGRAVPDVTLGPEDALRRFDVKGAA
jgi:threonine synthase